MKFEIETYKGQLIEYDDSYDKFVCDISIEDKSKTEKRLSLSDVRKAIDNFIKLNADFKPFKALEISAYDKDTFKVVNVLAIRTDGKLVVGGLDGNYKSHYGKKEMSRIMAYDSDIVEKEKKLDAEKRNAVRHYLSEVKKLCEKLIPIDLSKYEHIINPSD